MRLDPSIRTESHSGRVVSLAPVEVPADEAPTTEEVRSILGAAMLAPSAWNAQPWRFAVRGERIECRRADLRCLDWLDFEDGATHASLGAMLENLALRAARLGLCADVALFPEPCDPPLVATVTLTRSRDALAEPDLEGQIRNRHTNRRVGVRAPLPKGTAAALREAANGTGARLLLVEDAGALDALAPLVGAAERLALTVPAMRHELRDTLRWNHADLRARPHGLDVATLDLSLAERAVLRLGVVPPGIGPALEAPGRQRILGASAIGLVTWPGSGPEGHVRGGRALQRVWLAATALGLGVQPLGHLPSFFARLDRGGEGFTRAQAVELTRMRAVYRSILRPPPDHAEVALFRVVQAAPPDVRAGRAALDDVLLFRER
jgi:nitroreductase